CDEAPQNQYVNQWEMLFDETYGENRSVEDPTFNITGWNSSYTGNAIDGEEMREWVEQTTARIKGLNPGSVLEIGCGTGLLLFRIAPQCERYFGADFSRTAIDSLRRQLSGDPALSHVELSARRADELEDIKAESFDLAILNSVVQYFPNVEYLVQVLEGAVNAVEDGGIVFVGDVRSLALLEAFYASIQMHQSPSLSKAQLQRRIKERLKEEEELVID